MVIRFLEKARKMDSAAEIANKIKTFVFFDLETTGLPHLENNKTKITELTMIAVQGEHLSLGCSCFPRLQNKLTLCFNPRKLISPKAEELTGLSNISLENFQPFSSKTVESINLFLDHNPKPVCLVAHNGNKFDYPIFRAEINRTGVSLVDRVLCIDTLIAFKELYRDELKEKKTQTLTQMFPNGTDLAVDKNDQDVPLEFQDGFDEILCKIVEDYENSGDHDLKKALNVQKINETTPVKRKKTSLNMSMLDDAVIEEETVTNDFKILDSAPTGAGVLSKSKKMKVVKSRKKLNFGSPSGGSFKLGDVYRRLTDCADALDAHRAESDVTMLVRCAMALGERFVDWADKNARSFCDMPVMVPGKKMAS